MNKRAKYYDFDYISEKIPFGKLRKWMAVSLNYKFHLPNPNPFISDPHDWVFLVWYKGDETFYLPKSTIHIRLYSPLVAVTPSHINPSIIFVNLIQDAVNEFGSDAQVANIYYSIYHTDTGFSIQLTVSAASKT